MNNIYLLLFLVLVCFGCETKKDDDPRKLHFVDITYSDTWYPSHVYFDSTRTLVYRQGGFGAIYPDTISGVSKLTEKQYKILENIIFALDSCKIDSAYYDKNSWPDYHVYNLIIKTRKKTITSYIEEKIPVLLLDSLIHTLFHYGYLAKKTAKDTGFNFLSDPDKFRPFKGPGLVLVPGATFTMGKSGTDSYSSN